MDNLTHSLVGVLVAKSGLERLSHYAVPAAIIAANVPDLDLVSVADGRWSYLEHHRGFSHSLVGTLLLALTVPAVFWVIDRGLVRFRQTMPRMNLPGLALVSLIAAATHPLLDWTNNYGVRPLLPWSGRWFYGDLVFVMDPWLWLILGGAAFLITSQSRIGIAFWSVVAGILSVALIVAKIVSVPSPSSRLELPALCLWFGGLIALAYIRRSGVDERRVGRVALAALLFIPIYWGGMAWAHHRAFERAQTDATAMAEDHNEQLRRVAAMPTFANPFRWQVLAETDGGVYRFTEDLRLSPPNSNETDRFPKPTPAQASLVTLAERDPRVRTFMDFARFPVVEVTGDCGKDLVVRFADLRYTEPSEGRTPFAVDVPIDCSGGVFPEFPLK